MLCISISSYAQVRVTVSGDTLNGNVKRVIEYKHIQYSYGAHDSQIYIYEWDTVNRIASAVLYDPSKQVIGKWSARYDDSNRLISTEFYDHGELANKLSIEYGESGVIKEEYHQKECRYRYVGFQSWLYDMAIIKRVGYCFNIVKEYNYDDRGNLQIAIMSVDCLSPPEDNGARIENYYYDEQGLKDSVIAYSIYNPTIDTIEVEKKVFDKNGYLVKKQIDNKREWIRNVTEYEYDNEGSLNESNHYWFSTYGWYTDTTAEITSYKYSSHGKKTEETEVYMRYVGAGWPDTSTINITKYNSVGDEISVIKYNNTPGSNMKNWTSDGIEVTTKTIYEYDDYNNMISETEYSRKWKDDYYEFFDTTSGVDTAIFIGKRIEYIYDSRSRKKASITYHLYRETNGAITMDEKYNYEIPENERLTIKLDEHGNIIQHTEGGNFYIKREIEYY